VTTDAHTTHTREDEAACVEVIQAGALTTIQDAGRPGYAHLGVPRSGAADLASLRLANRLVGNPADTAALETTMLGMTVRPRTGRWWAVTGAPCQVRVADRVVSCDQPIYVPAGAVLRVGPAVEGVRTYLAVSGGIAVPAVFGSRATDTLSGIGPPPVRDGDVLPLGTAAAPPSTVDVVPRPAWPQRPQIRLRLCLRTDWFTAASVARLAAASYQVTAHSDRVGVRLAGPALERTVHEELPSEGMVLGAVQVPPDGQPVILLADHPTTGGYPVVGVVEPDDLWLVAQARPGTEVQFRLIR